MEKTQLDKYRDFISKMSDEDRNLYFKRVATGEIKAPITGYPYLDRVWLKNYSKDFLREDIPKLTIFEYMKSLNIGHEDLSAINYFCNHISYGQLYSHIDNASKALTSLGVKKDDRIMYLMPNIPETAYLLYGGSRIGAISDYIDPRPDSIDRNISAQKTLKLVEQEKAKYLIALDQCYLAMLKPIENELKELGLDSIVVASASDSMGTREKIHYLLETANFEGLKALKAKLIKMKMIEEKFKEARANSPLAILDYKSLVRDSRFVSFSSLPYEKDKIDLITHTSGTSSPMPKPIVLTTENLNAYVHQTFGANMTMAVGDKALHMLPYFAAYGVVDVTHAGLCHGNELIQVPEFLPSNFGKLILKYKPQTIIGTPSWFLNLINDPVIKNADLSFIKMICYGGDSMEIEDEIKLNRFLAAHNCHSKITKGHGMSETAGCASYAIGEYNVLGSMGVPMPHAVYGIVDPDTKEPLRFEKGKDVLEGELIIHGETVTPGILDGKVIVPHAKYDGMDFIYTRDIAQMDRNGIMQFLTRSDRSFTRFDGFKVKPYEIENLLKTDEAIKYCIISPIFDEKRFGNIILATIVLEDGVEMNEEERLEFVKNLIDKYFVKNPNVSSRQIPFKIRFRDSLLYSANSKGDFNAYTKEGLNGEEFTIELEETNISVDSIKVIPPQSSEKIQIRNRKK